MLLSNYPDEDSNIFYFEKKYEILVKYHKIQEIKKYREKSVAIKKIFIKQSIQIQKAYNF